MRIMITGVTSGFGEAMARLLIAEGHQVLGTGRRRERLETLQQEWGDSFYPLAFDIASREDTERAWVSLPPSWRTLDVLVNNAGLALGLDLAPTAQIEDWERMIETNVLGLCRLTRRVLPNMVARKSGLIINMGSIAGTYPYPGGNVYGATKAFVKQFSLNLRADLAGTRVRVCNIEPGLCGGTEFSQVRFKGDTEKAQALYEGVDYIRPEDIANIVHWVIQQPAHVNINSIEVMPTAQSFAALTVTK